MKSALKVISLVLALGACAAQTADERLSVKVYATSGCTDTVWFVQNQLNPVVEELGQYLDVDFIVWGRTVRGATGVQSCQFGAPDCWANQVQRCSLSLLGTQEARMHYIDCEYRSNTDRPAFLLGSYLCAHAAGVNIVTLDYCVSNVASPLGAQVVAAAEAATAVPMELVDFVPAIVLGDAEANQATSMVTFFGLRAAVCAALQESGVTAC